MRFFATNIEKLHDPSQDTGSARLHLCAKKSMNFVSNFLELPKKGEKTSKKKNERKTFYAMLYLLPVL